ncbi:uncharacterized protein STEHIDRAFT_162406 [Stereum hirsutum FP-91666 SS1]|uniref:uncharacterized protein n=1 Tax=Stereum hirsutum (strain FP-91666) TaxID=721885 RepID=UPI0004449987|nr:uncharacterized protein STEHIDRAFT_162406 [Stereum hirsutum FP-91666 SS1]EIM80624.1 hypothetical protein STEHIDRAFT_162406 [Stereum hirsutum FP-91666 SS1]
MTTPATSATVLSTSTPSAILAPTNDTNSAPNTAPIQTANGMVPIGNTLPQRSEWSNAGRCAKPLEEGKACSYHAGMTHDQLLFDVGYVGEDYEEDEEAEEDEDEDYEEDEEVEEAAYAIIWVCYNDDSSTQAFELVMPNWPFFHPKDVPDLAKDVLLADDSYWRYDEELKSWLKTTSPFRLDAGKVLYLFAVNVTDFSGLPGSTSLNVPSTPTKPPFAHTKFPAYSSSPAKRFRISKFPSSDHFF